MISGSITRCLCSRIFPSPNLLFEAAVTQKSHVLHDRNRLLWTPTKNIISGSLPRLLLWSPLLSPYSRRRRWGRQWPRRRAGWASGRRGRGGGWGTGIKHWTLGRRLSRGTREPWKQGEFRRFCCPCPVDIYLMGNAWQSKDLHEERESPAAVKSQLKDNSKLHFRRELYWEWFEKEIGVPLGSYLLTKALGASGQRKRGRGSRASSVLVLSFDLGSRVTGLIILENNKNLYYKKLYKWIPAGK